MPIRFARLCVLIVGLLTTFSGCSGKIKSDAKSSPPAKVELLPRESELASLTLTDDAVKRLGIQTVAIERKTVQQRRTFGGEVIIPPGKSIQVTAPIGGRLIESEARSFPRSGLHVTRGQALLTLAPLLSPERDVPTPAEQVQMAGARATLVAAQVTAMGDAEKSAADVAAANINVDRAKKLLADRAGSQRAVDDAVAFFKVADANLNAARNRYEELTALLQKIDAPPGEVAQALTIEIMSPLDGVIRNVNISQLQPVVSGAPLFEVIDLASVWVRVSIFVDLLSTLETEAPANIVKLDGSSMIHPTSGKEIQFTAMPAEAPPSALAVTSSADIYYEVPNEMLHLRPGQRVGVSIPVDQQITAVVLPSQTILFDYHGGAWVYVQTASNKFQRARVNPLWFDGDVVVVEDRLAGDWKVVTDGAAELFGTEFGPGK